MPVLLHSQLQDCIKLLLKHRPSTKVTPNNPYLFGIHGYDKHRYKHLKACNLMREYSSNCGALKPLILRGTSLRKHIATKCITLNLSESEITELANFMGHDKNIHKSHYRQSIPEIDIPRFSRLLNVAIFNEENENEEIQQNAFCEDNISESSSDDVCTNNNIPLCTNKNMLSSSSIKTRRSSKHTFN